MLAGCGSMALAPSAQLQAAEPLAQELASELAAPARLQAAKVPTAARAGARSGPLELHQLATIRHNLSASEGEHAGLMWRRRERGVGKVARTP